jgi:hypothetical protein
MAADGVWHRGVAATHGGVALSNLAGYVTIALAAKGANGEKSRWYVDNLTVSGRIRPQARLPVQPRITALAPPTRFGSRGSPRINTTPFSTPPV